jgi:hypothetical protein
LARLTEEGGTLRSWSGGTRYRPKTNIVSFVDHIGHLICRLGNTYAENHETADNGLVLGVGGLVVEGADEALLGPRAGGNDALVRGHCVYDVGYEGRTFVDVDVDVGVMIGRREICGLGTLGVTASLAPIGNRISFARAVKDDATASSCLSFIFLFHSLLLWTSQLHSQSHLLHHITLEIGCLHIVH